MGGGGGVESEFCDRLWLKPSLGQAEQYYPSHLPTSYKWLICWRNNIYYSFINVLKLTYCPINFMRTADTLGHKEGIAKSIAES